MYEGKRNEKQDHDEYNIVEIAHYYIHRHYHIEKILYFAKIVFE